MGARRRGYRTGMSWNALPADDPFDVAGVEERPRLRVVEQGPDGFISQLGLGWIIVLAAMAVGAVLLAALVWQPMMSLR
jgi:hypothetical protein